jgi:RNA polymerase sigma factor (sigma-70 family)
MTELLSEAIPLVDEIVRALRRRHRLSSEEAEELASATRLKLVEDDHAVLRKYTGRSSLRTYLVTVMTRLLLDSRRRRWGKWRPSVIARRLGAVALRLEELLRRDGRSLDEASRVLKDEGAVLSAAECEALAGRLPERRPRPVEASGPLGEVGVPGDVAEAAVRGRERGLTARAVESGLGAALEVLTPQERLILRLRFDEGFKVGEIARVLHVPEKPLFRRLERLLARLRSVLEARGVSAGDVAEVLGSAEWDPRRLLRAEENAPAEDV